MEVESKEQQKPTEPGKPTEEQKKSEPEKPAEKPKTENQPTKTQIIKRAKDEQINELYSSQSIEVKMSIQENNKLTELEKEKKKISIKIENEKLEKKGFLSKLYSCSLSCEELNSKIERNNEDFEWLKRQLNEKYPLIYIPPLPPKSDDMSQISRYLNKFFDALLRKKILRTSQILYDFLTQDNENFAKNKENLDKEKFKLSNNMDNFKSTKETYKVDFSKEQITNPEKYIKKIEPSKILYNSLFQTLNSISQELKNLSKHMKDLSQIFANLHKNARDTDQSNFTKSAFDTLKVNFNSLSSSYEKQSLFYEKDFNEFFNFLHLELNELNILQKEYLKYRKDYETSGLDYLSKRDKLFNEKKFNKWELSKEDEANLNEFKDDYSKASKYILKAVGDNVNSQKIKVACSCNIVMKEYKKVSKYVGEQLKHYLESLKEKNSNIVGDANEMLKLFDIQIS